MRTTVLILGLVAIVPAFAQRAGVRYIGERAYTVARSRDYQEGRRDGKCTIRVNIDDEADVVLRGDRLLIEVIKGAPGEEQRNPGSECNSPLPKGGISNFQFRGRDGRGNVRLVQEPRASNGWSAIVNIQDPKGGMEGYTFDLTWNYDGSSGGSGGGGGGFFPGPSNPANGEFSGTGSGDLRKGNSSMRIDRATINLRNNGSFILDLYAPERVRFTGMYRGSGNRYDLDVNGGFGTEGARGNGRVEVSGNQLTLVEVNGNTVRYNDRFEGRFRSGGGFGGNGGGSGGLGDLSLAQTGRGNFDNGQQTVQITRAEIEVRNGSTARLNFRSDRGDTLTLEGEVANVRGVTFEVNLRSSNQGSASGVARVAYSRGGFGGNSITRVEVNDANLNGRRFTLRFAR
jgi:hypothetical protein